VINGRNIIFMGAHIAAAAKLNLYERTKRRTLS